MKGLTSLAVAFLVLGTPIYGAPPATAAPDIALTTETGATIRLFDLKGQVVLLDFWASWCVPCATAFPAIDRLQSELRDRGFTVLAINVDEDRRNAERFLSSRPHGVTVLFDAKGRAAEAFRLQGMPSSVLVDRAGRIRVTHTGYTEKTIAQYRAEILALLGES